MKNRVYILLVSLIITSTANADIGGNVHVLRGENDLSVGTAEYYWSKGKFSGFGFYDQFNHGTLRYFTDHSLDYSLNDYVFLSGEVGRSSFGDMQKVGVGVRLGALFPEDHNPFLFLNVTRYAKVWGADVENTEISWQTKSLSLGNSVSVYLSGFADIRDNAPDVKQPQIWFTFGDSKFEVGAELDMFGDKETLLIAVKYNF